MMYLVEKTLNKLYNDGYTNFLNPKELKEVCNHLKKNTFYIYKPFPDSEKNIVYFNDLPPVILFEIVCPIKIRHQDILGTLYSLGIEDNLFGDIILDNNHYYFYTFLNMQTFFEMEFTKIKNTKIKLISKDINELNEYHPKFEELQVINSSLRIDSLIAKIINTNREKVKDLIKEKQIMYNYDILKDNDKLLEENDIFSIRKYGKYKYCGIISKTKKKNYLLKIVKYVSE